VRILPAAFFYLNATLQEQWLSQAKKNRQEVTSRVKQRLTPATAQPSYPSEWQSQTEKKTVTK